ncbi:hypothetical protein B2G71_12315 [Novosphingobium sp. PC22D]|uniref:hypothetical protein n=1 Tax=Novosphingobium sp. PC22D TaxID=1962403 RepID=UPI000BEFED67|nr:hypothetical protein [Novosphingobium sp. PC22D]PEQ12285.1 hypothetical protein B2G71_12315 [Novosphingobium sp. PC22D]
MTTLRGALIWAFVLVLFAAGVRFGLIAAEAGRVLLLALPVLAVTTTAAARREGAGRDGSR